MDSSVKIQILLFLILLGVFFISFMIIIRSIGEINHIYDRFEEIITKETILRLERLEKDVRIVFRHPWIIGIPVPEKFLKPEIIQLLRASDYEIILTPTELQ